MTLQRTALRPRVLFAQRRLPHYRVPLLEETRRLLALQGVEFDFIYGEPTADERRKKDEGELAWAQRMKRTWYGLNGKLCWQPFATRGYALVIVSQENRLLINHWLCRPWRDFKLAFFSHGANLSASNKQSFPERFRAWTTRQADWMFAYTALSVNLIAQTGFAPARITVMNNSIDTRVLRAELASVTEAECQTLRSDLGLRPGKTGLFLGSLYAGKGLEVLLHAAKAAHEADADFRLLVVGDGPAAADLQQAIAQQPWVRWLGARVGPDKARFMAVSDFLMLPAAVGLSILDGFAAGLPLITRDVIGHGPEIAYLSHGVNGLRSYAGSQAYAQTVVSLLADAHQLASLKAGALSAGQAYSVEAMAENFANGIVQCLNT